MRKLALLLISVCCLRLSAADQQPLTIDLDEFFAEPDCSSMQLSPDGKSLAFLTTLGYGKVGIALMHLDTNQTEALVSAKDENIKTFFWKGSDYIVFGGDLKGEEIYAWRSIAVKAPADGGARKVVALAEAFEKYTATNANFISNIVSLLRSEPENILVFGRKEIGGGSVSYFKLNVRNGSRSSIGTDETTFSDTGTIADNLGNIRIREILDDKNKTIEVRRQPGQRYAEVAHFPANGEGWSFLEFGADNETAYLIDGTASDTGSLRAYNVRTGEMSPPLFTPEGGEIQSLLMSPDKGRLDGVLYVTDKPHYHFFNPARARLQEVLDKSLPGNFNDVIGSSLDEKTLLIVSRSDRDRGRYLVFDRTKGQIRAIAKVSRKVDPARMQPMEPVSFTARDGLVIHGYLTRPANSAGKAVPLILNPHGGPYGIRDEWHFNPEVQFLSRLGFAVLQVNYRGSGGYGSKFLHAGYHEWGRKMQDDLTDAVHWAIDQGIADPKRVVIYGASYGGYATLAGLVFTPDLYCCGINYVGPSDMVQATANWKISNSKSLNRHSREAVGEDIDYLKSISPANFIERLHVPLLNAYGFHDPRVDIEQWNILERQLKAHHKPYEILVEDNEGHGFRNEANRLAYYSKVSEFLQRNALKLREGQVGAGELKVIQVGVPDHP